MKKLTRFLLLACLLCWKWCVSVREIVVSEQGSQLPSCLDEHNHIPCQSLVAVSRNVTHHRLNNIVIRINGTHYTLEGVANFSGVENITITGEQTHISCGSSEAGIVFERSSDIRLTHFVLTDCGATISNDCGTQQLTGNITAIYITSCSQVTITDIEVSESVSQGITFINTGATVQVTDSYFINNTATNGCGGGLQVIFDSTEWECYNCTGASYTLSNNVFMNYTVGCRIQEVNEIFDAAFCERGGGIRIINNVTINNDTCNENISITMENNVMENNYAVFGGGLFIILMGNTTYTMVNLLNNNFMNNNAFSNGGGISAGFTKNDKFTYPVSSLIKACNTTFTDNNAYFGGALSFFTGFISFYLPHGYNQFICEDCHFEGNTARGGSAVIIVPDIFKHSGTQYVSTIRFINCTVKNNYVILNDTSSVSEGNGAFFVSDLDVSLAGLINFTNNNGTALYLDSAYVIFVNGSIVHFSNNHGYQGGAILFFGKSNMYIGNSGYFQFYNNSATKFGGAICALTGGQRAFAYLNSCFLRGGANTEISINTHFDFFNNSAELGNDIFATSIASCNAFCAHQYKEKNRSNFFDHSCYGNFTFNNNLQKPVATSPINITINDGSSLSMFPGIPTNLSITQYDELQDNVGKFFPLTTRIKSSTNPKVRVDFNRTNNNIITILGNPKDEVELLLESQTIRHTLNFQFNNCPPGYVIEPNETKCLCSSEYYNQLTCGANGTVEAAVNTWVGYDDKNITNTSYYNLLTGNCVAQLCMGDDPVQLPYQRSLPLSASPNDLRKAICGDDRYGTLCARCVANKSVYYHSDNYTCDSNRECQYGVLYYIGTEIIPVTIIFLIILIFNISLTSGALYSFVFYAQTLSVLRITAFGIIHIDNNNVRNAILFYRVLLGIFNFEILNLSVCVIPTDSIMKLFMIKYATLLYAFFLVLATILLLRLHSCYSCVKLCRRCGRRNIRGSIVDGLSAFLVLCYFQCAFVTSQILTPSYLYGYKKNWKKTVPLFDGELEYFRGSHLFYAVPALLCLIFILIPPPTILLLEPLLTKMFSMDCFTRTYGKWLYNRLRLKLMPFLDSFQACFKDRKRYFAGLYFVYRLLIPLVGVLLQSPQQYYGAVVCFFFFILLLHAVLRPYKNKRHSMLEVYLLINIIMIFIITVYNYAYHENTKKKLVCVQLVLIYLSIVYIFVYTIFKIHQKFPLLSWCKRKATILNTKETSEVSSDSESLPFRLLNNVNNDVSDDFSDSYRTF